MGLIHKPVNTKLCKKKTKKKTKTNCVVSLHPESVMYSEKKKLNCRYCTTEVWNVKMILKTK